MPIDWSDKRPIETLRFGAEWKPTIGDLQAAQPGFGATGAEYPLRLGDPPTDEVLDAWKKTHKAELDRLMAILSKSLGCTIAEDIVALGCTGMSARCHDLVLAPADFFETAKFLRMGLAGSGVGLPCYVPHDRFCLVHEVTGGLQEGQAQKYPEQVEMVSRLASPTEKLQDELTDRAMRSGAESENSERSAAAVLAGRRLPEGWEKEGATSVTDEQRDKNIKEYMDRGGITAKVDAVAADIVAQQWKCPDHTETNWRCRYCVAQMIVEGALLPSYLFALRKSDGAPTVGDVAAEALGPTLHGVQQDERVVAVQIHVQLARYERKLTRVE